MKKLIATAAGLMLVGAMASTAAASVSVSGDARARLYFQDNFDLNDDVDDKDQKINSRVRIVFNGEEEKSKAFAKARIKIGDGTFDGGRDTGGVEVQTDYAYMGMPLGPVTVSAGRQVANFGHKFWGWDGRVDRLKAVWSQEGTTVSAFYDKWVEFIPSQATVIIPGLNSNTGLAENVNIVTSGVDARAEASDEDVNRYGATVKHAFGDWSVQGIAIYRDNEVQDSDAGEGWTASFAFSGKVASTSLVGELSYKEAGYTNSVDDQWGGFIAAVMSMGQATVILPLAYTADGYITDNDFKPTYLYGTVDPMGILDFGQGGDTWAFAPSVDYKLSDQLTLHGAIAYADIDELATLVEFDAGVQYNLSDKTWTKVRFAYGIPDGANDLEADDFSAGMIELGTVF